MKQIQIATYFLIFIHFLRMIFRRVHSEKQCKYTCSDTWCPSDSDTWCPSDSSFPLALYYRMREGGNFNLYALVFYLDDEGIRAELLRLLMRDFDGEAIHYLNANLGPVEFLTCFPRTRDLFIANTPILDITKWLDLLHNKVQVKFFKDPKHGNFRYDDFFIERIEE